MPAFDLRDSKLYKLARSTTLYSELVPDITTQIKAEVDLDEFFAREESDGDASRILFNYTNKKGNSTLFKIANHERFQSELDIDHFIENYSQHMADESLPEDSVDAMKVILLTAMTFACGSVLGFEEGSDKLSHWFISAATTVLYDDPLDVVINVVDAVSQETGNVIPTITNMWRVKQRPNEMPLVE